MPAIVFNSFRLLVQGENLMTFDVPRIYRVLLNKKKLPNLHQCE